MNELIKISSENMVSGRELHRFLEVDSNFTTWF
jgi:phage anti-repressor protein